MQNVRSESPRAFAHTPSLSTGGPGGISASANATSSSSGVRRKTSVRRQAGTPIKVIVIGNATVGKTTLNHSFFHHGGQACIEETARSSSLTPYSRVMSFPAVTSHTLDLTFVDTAGQERYRSMVNSMYRQIHVVVCVVDSKDPSTLSDLKNKWIPDAKQTVPSNCIWLVAINKSDIFHEPVEAEKAREEIFKALPKTKSRSRKRSGTKTLTTVSLDEGVPDEAPPHHHQQDDDEVAAAAASAKVPKSAAEVVLSQITIENVFTELKPLLPGLERLDVLYTSGRYGYNVNALFLRATWRRLGVLSNEELPEAIRVPIRDVVMSFFQEHYTSDYRAFKTVLELRNRPGVDEVVDELAPPTPIHVTPRSGAGAVAGHSPPSSSHTSSTTLAAVLASANEAYIPRPALEAVVAAAATTNGTTNTNGTLESGSNGNNYSTGNGRAVVSESKGRAYMSTELEDSKSSLLTDRRDGSDAAPVQSSCAC